MDIFILLILVEKTGSEKFTEWPEATQLETGLEPSWLECTFNHCLTLLSWKEVWKIVLGPLQEAGGVGGPAMRTGRGIGGLAGTGP